MSEYIFSDKKDFEGKIFSLVEKVISKNEKSYNTFIKKLYIALFPSFKEVLHTEFIDPILEKAKHYTYNKFSNEINDIVFGEAKKIEFWLEQLSEEQSDMFFQKVLKIVNNSEEIWDNLYNFMLNIESEYSMFIEEEDIKKYLSHSILRDLEHNNSRLYFEIDHEYPILERQYISILKAEVIETVQSKFNELIKSEAESYNNLKIILENNMVKYIRPQEYDDVEHEFYENIFKICVEAAYFQYDKQIERDTQI
ncbi:hypothetical protein ACQKMV_07885 [Lysinibacillus sp. NPDC094403]|uniref:hypothetical protein n=1 Tax=Lysinibacillus sp. NPDC094403 TaxID=3390581 RepID=UPI003D06BA20